MQFKKFKKNNIVETNFGLINDFKKNINSYLGDNSMFLIVDQNTVEYIDYISKSISKNIIHLVLPQGERNKTLENVSKVWDFLKKNKLKRNDTLFILGGGMVSDLAGFAASTYNRGIEFVFFPTTLLAMADASIGGKNGFNYDFLKNNIGTFTNPKAIFFDTTFLKSLPKKEMYSGLAEIYKHSIITDLNLWNYLNENSNQLNYDYLVKTSSNLKLEIVNIDPYEKNIRKKLNFGHTVGHSIESYLLNINKPTLHGFAIAKGMIIESFIAKKENLLNEDAFNEIKGVLNNKFEAYLNFKIEPKAILKLMLSDKKNTKDSINFSLPTRIGKVTINHEIEFEKLESYLLEFFTND